MWARKTVLTAALALCAVVRGFADVPATFILTNGQRHDGTVIYGRGSNNIVDGRFHLLEAGADRSYAIDEVAAIDFVGGMPDATELRQVPNTPVMVMRDGSVVRGSLHNIIGNDNVQWVNEGGQRNNYPVQSVRRLYLKPDVAKLAFGGGAATPAPGSPQAPAGGTVVQVDARQPWTDSGIDVRRGDRLIFSGRGDIMIASGASSGVGGNPALRGLFPVANAPAGALIGRIGNRNVFAIGANTQPITMVADGRLMLGVNDDNFRDNSGTYTVAVSRDSFGSDNQPRRRPFGRDRGVSGIDR